jgi:hypothetical protein
VNGQAEEALTPLQLQSMFSRPGATLTVQLSRANQTIILILKLVERL